MKLGSLSSSPRAVYALVAAVVLLYVVAAWFLLVSPKRAEAARLQDEVAAAEQQVADARSSTGGSKAPTTRVSDLFRLAEAMPSSREQASLLLQLDAVARQAGVTAGGVTIQDPTTLAGGTVAVPVTVTVTGSYRQISRYLTLTRRLVGLRGDRPNVVGRLLTVQSVDLTASKEDGFPRLDAAILFNAHAYDGPVAPATPPPGTDTTTTETTPIATAQTTASAAGATP
jgi:Tfp pilus assembly protein PilO